MLQSAIMIDRQTEGQTNKQISGVYDKYNGGGLVRDVINCIRLE